MLPQYSLYSASKACIDQMSRVLSKEIGSKGIHVNTVAPGPTDTEFFRQGKDEESIKRFAGMSALGRIGTPEDIANAISW